MNKIGIITYHFANNYGAMLQCYALLSSVREQGNSCEVLNYISNKQQNNNALYRHGSIKNEAKNIILMPFHRVRQECQGKMEAFRQSELLTGQRLDTLDDLRNHIETEKISILISGSDQVWNPNVDDFEEAFFFPFNTTARKIGFAVSLGNADKRELLKYKPWIEDFSIITVREESSKQMIESISDKPASSVMDPVFLLSRNRWEKLANAETKEKNYLLCYFVKKSELKEKVNCARIIAKKYGLRLIILSPRITMYSFSRVSINNAGPIEFLSYIKHASYVYTDSFHGTAFSMIFNKQFCSVESDSERSDNRKRDLLKKYGLDNRIGRTNDMSICSESTIDYSSVNKMLAAQRLQMIGILQSMIANEQR